MLHFEQDPNGPFNPATLTTLFTPVSEWAGHPVSVLATFGWVIPALLGVALMLYSARLPGAAEPSTSKRRGNVWFAGFIALFIGFVWFCVPSTVKAFGGDKPDSPLAVLSLEAGDYLDSAYPKYTDATGEFATWAFERYELELSPRQAELLTRKASSGRYSYHDYSRGYTVDGTLVYSTFSPLNRVLLFGADDKELPVTPTK